MGSRLLSLLIKELKEILLPTVFFVVVQSDCIGHQPTAC